MSVSTILLYRWVQQTMLLLHFLIKIGYITEIFYHVTFMQHQLQDVMNVYHAKLWWKMCEIAVMLY